MLSSQIEGAQSSLADLLLLELDEAPGGPLGDVIEVSNHVAALDHGLERLRDGVPLSNRLTREIHGVLLSRGRGAGKNPGEFRRSQNWIGGSRPGNAVFVPPPHTAVCRRESPHRRRSRFRYDPCGDGNPGPWRRCCPRECPVAWDEKCPCGGAGCPGVESRGQERASPMTSPGGRCLRPHRRFGCRKARLGLRPQVWGAAAGATARPTPRRGCFPSTPRLQSPRPASYLWEQDRRPWQDR